MAPLNPASMSSTPGVIFDGKRMRKAITRRAVDHSASICRWLEEYNNINDHEGEEGRNIILPDPQFIHNVIINSSYQSFLYLSLYNDVICR